MDNIERNHLGHDVSGELEHLEVTLGDGADLGLVERVEGAGQRDEKGVGEECGWISAARTTVVDPYLAQDDRDKVFLN